jgi:acyl carrier protein
MPLINEALEQELRELIVEALVLEDVRPEQIGAETPLFADGLGLDSIDALELSLAIERRYRVKIASDDTRNRKLFASVRALAAHIATRRADRTGAAT